MKERLTAVIGLFFHQLLRNAQADLNQTGHARTKTRVAENCTDDTFPSLNILKTSTNKNGKSRMNKPKFDMGPFFSNFKQVYEQVQQQKKLFLNFSGDQTWTRTTFNGRMDDWWITNNWIV